MGFTIKMGDYYFSITYFDIPDGFRRYFRGSRRAALRVFCPDLYCLMPSGAEPKRDYREICVKLYIVA